jgi:SAM-dependent methyltransferase
MSDRTTITEQVKKIYESEGWVSDNGVTSDAKLSEDLRPVAADYLTACRLRVLRHLPRSGSRLLDMASGPLQYPEYLKYSEGYNTRVCVDLSQRALDAAKSKIGSHGEYHAGDFFVLDIGQVDAAVSLHTLYHIEKSRQEAVVRKLIDVTKPGGTIVIVYSNPAYIVSMLFSWLKPKSKNHETLSTIYFHRHPLAWWDQFGDSGTISIYPWRTFATREQRLLFPSNRLGKAMFAGLFKLENRYPRVFAAIGCYPMIVIRKQP